MHACTHEWDRSLLREGAASGCKGQGALQTQLRPLICWFRVDQKGDCAGGSGYADPEARARRETRHVKPLLKLWRMVERVWLTPEGVRRGRPDTPHSASRALAPGQLCSAPTSHQVWACVLSRVTRNHPLAEPHPLTMSGFPQAGAWTRGSAKTPQGSP